MPSRARILFFCLAAPSVACTTLLGATDVPSQGGDAGRMDANNGDSRLGDAGSDHTTKADARHDAAPTMDTSFDAPPDHTNPSDTGHDTGHVDAGMDASVCSSGSSRCVDMQPQSCTGGQWANAGASCATVCNSGSCGACAPGALQCNGLQPQTCGDGGAWANTGSACQDACDAGHCQVTYVGEVLADKPLAYWRLGESALADPTVDMMGKYTGSYSGDVLFSQKGAIAGDTNTAIYLNMNNGQGMATVLDPLAETLEFSGASQTSFTVEVWIQPTVVDTSYRGVLSNESNTPSRDGYVMYVGGFTDGGSGVGLSVFNNGSERPSRDGSVVHADMKWYHVVGVSDPSAGTLDLYVNGQRVASQPDNLSIPSFASCSFNIGATHCGTTGFFRGLVDEVAVYGTALSQARVNAHYQAAQ